MFSFSQEDNVTCNLQANIFYYSQTSKQKRKLSHVSLAAGVKPSVTGDQRKNTYGEFFASEEGSQPLL